MRPVHFAAARRTPIGKLRGALSGVRPDDLAATVPRGLLDGPPSLDPARIDDVYRGAANQDGEDNRDIARMAVLLAGLPETVPGATVNRLCASGMEAVTGAARMIAAGEADIVPAGGSESMSRAPFVLARPEERCRAPWRRTTPGSAGGAVDSVEEAELNEAFAAQALASVRELGIDPEAVNPDGGAIALGHPLGCSGARILTTLLHRMRRTGARRGPAAMCVGVGQGSAVLVDRD